jgi:hypothetical protein
VSLPEENCIMHCNGMLIYVSHFSKHVAHVLNDESQRKYIQGLKRLMSKSQQYFKTDPSRSVDFIRDDNK